ncbi:MAG: hypothetical protein ACJ711_05415, partial [Ornithinibacter sp.]
GGPARAGTLQTYAAGSDPGVLLLEHGDLAGALLRLDGAARVPLARQTSMPTESRAGAAAGGSEDPGRRRGAVW